MSRLAGKLAGILASSTLLMTGSTVLLNSMSLDYASVIYACEVAIPGAIIAGTLGYFIGKLFETARITGKDRKANKKHGKDPELLIDDLLLDDLEKFNPDKK